VLISLPNKGPNSSVSVKDILDSGVVLGPDRIPVIHTGWTDKMWGKPEFWTQMPYLEPGVGELMASKGVPALGMDVFPEKPLWRGVKVEPGEVWQGNHLALMRKGIPLIQFMTNLAQIGPNKIAFKSWESVDQNPFFSPDPAIVPKLESFMDELRESGDSCGARVNVVASGVPVGWGEPVYGRLDSDIAAAMMGINAVKGVEIGAGFAAIEQKGSDHGDELTPGGFLSNHAGGTLGGISTGQDILVSIALKPTSSIRIPRRSIDRKGEPTTVQTTGRHDPCVGIRATPIAEAMLACVLMDHALRHRAQCGDVKPPLKPIPLTPTFAIEVRVVP